MSRGSSSPDVLDLAERQTLAADGAALEAGHVSEEASDVSDKQAHDAEPSFWVTLKQIWPVLLPVVSD